MVRRARDEKVIHAAAGRGEKDVQINATSSPEGVRRPADAREGCGQRVNL